MPELPEMQALAERLDAALGRSVLARSEPLGLSGLKTVAPSPGELTGRAVTGVRRRGKYGVIGFDGGMRIAFHLSQAGRVDLERPPKATRPRGSVVRWLFEAAPATEGADQVAVLVREHGSQRKAGWWVLAAGDDGPLATLGPEPDDPAFEELVRDTRSTSRLYTWLRDQRVVAGIGRGCTDDALNRAGLSPFATVASLDAPARGRLVDAVRAVLDEGLARERQRNGGLSEATLGNRFSVHRRAGQPCPRCGRTLLRVSFDSYELVYCTCQTDGRELADRRLSRLLR